jgi:DNA processing protein
MIKNWNIKDILVLLQSRKVNSREIKHIIDSYNSFEDFQTRNNDIVHKINPKTLFDKRGMNLYEIIDKQLKLCEQNNVNIITIWDENYPALLKEIHYPPPVLYVKGKLRESNTESISIVGTRRATSYGMLATEKFVKIFVHKGFVIVSGLANGIDTKSHLETIKNNGITYAVIASGINCINPAISNKNAQSIIEAGGAIISEYPCGTKALPAFFPQRNRIISGFSRATLIIESAEKGGSLITAKFAFDQERDVFALPGNVFSEKSKGTNKLIAKNLAIPALSPEYILSELGITNEKDMAMFKKEQMQHLDNQERTLLELINHEPKQIDDIAQQSGIGISHLIVKLLEMEFKGLIRQLPGKYYIKN